MKEDETDGPPFLQRYGFGIGVAAVVGIIGALFASQALSHHRRQPRKPQPIAFVRLLPPPPPPPLPPKPPEQRPTEDRMIQQMPVDDNEPKPDDKPKDQAAASQIGTSIRGDGAADGFGLGSDGSAGFFGSDGGTGGARSSRWGWYAGEVQTAIADALRRNVHTRGASFRIEVRIWPDAGGRITRVRLSGSTGDRAVDEAIKSEILAGFQLPEPPPPGMPRPIVLRLGARRPE